MNSVTLSDKRNWEWVFTCAGCDLLASSERSDTLTCSPACRVRAHRNGSIKSLAAVCEWLPLRDRRTGKPDVARFLHTAAVIRLRPDLAQQISAGTLTLDQAMPETYRAFLDFMRKKIAALDALEE
jgi:hypothetical protein